MPPIEKPRTNRRGGGRGVGAGRGGRRRGSGHRREKLRTDAEQLDYEMELLRAQREGREEEFKVEERAKLNARRAASLDAEMDDYFKKKPEKESENPSDKHDNNTKDLSEKPKQKSVPAPAEAPPGEAAV